MTALAAGLLVVLAAGFAVVAFAARWRAIMARPFARDYSPARGSASQGVLYAFTLGMAPWAKESTRRHWVAYGRGIVFHLGIFAGLAALVASPAWGWLPAPVRLVWAAGLALGAACGAAGAAARWLEPNLRAVSTPDDHLAVWLVTAFLAAGSLALFAPVWLPAFYVVAALMLVYAPLGKIRHCLYFFFSRRFFGLFGGRRGVIHPEVAR
jgi:hypothetical protein